MAVQRLHAFEKTSIQARHTIKRLEVLAENAHSTPEEKAVAELLLDKFKEIRNIIPGQFQDVDLAKE